MKFSSIVPFLGYYYEDKDTCHLVFEKMACDLSTMKLADLKKEVRLNIAKQVCAAMSYLHSKDFVHRYNKYSFIKRTLY
jgi:serine/threonine protein kinase